MTGTLGGIGNWTLGMLTSKWTALALAGAIGWDKLSGKGYTEAFGKAVGHDFSNEGLKAGALALWNDQLWPKVEGVIKGATEGDFRYIALFYFRDLYGNEASGRVNEILEKIKNWDVNFVNMIYEDIGSKIDPTKAFTFLSSTVIGQAISNGGNLTGNTLLNVVVGMVITGAVHFGMKKVLGQKEMDLKLDQDSNIDVSTLPLSELLKLSDAHLKKVEAALPEPPQYSAPSPDR